MPRVNIIGAGIGGLATALLLAKKEFEVHVFEQNSYPGGKCHQLQMGDFRFDAGPSLFTLPEYLEDVLGEAIPKHQLQESCRYFWKDFQLRFPTDPQAQLDCIQHHFPEDVKAFENYLKKSDALFRLTEPFFLKRSLHKRAFLLHPKTWMAALKLGSLKWWLNLSQYNRSVFKDVRLAQIFDRFATYNGSNPYKAPSTLRLISSLEMSRGAFLPKGGMHSITRKLFEKASSLNVNFHFNSRVETIQHSKGRVLGIETGGKFWPSDYCVSNRDVLSSFPSLLPKKTFSKKLGRLELSTSALVFYWGIKGTYPSLGLHNIFFSKNYKQEFAYLFEGSAFQEASIYVHISSKLEPSDAPEDAENWFVMVNAPSDIKKTNSEWRAQQRAFILKTLSENLGRNIEEDILCEDYLDPQRIFERTGSREGALYGPASNQMHSAFLRQANFSKKMKNLFFVGGSVHPGGGVPLCLSSAKIVSNLIGHGKN